MNYKRITWFLIGFLLSIPAGFLNGYGSDTVFYFFKYIPNVAVYEAEWAGIWRLLHDVPTGLLLPYQWQIAGYLVWLCGVVVLGVWGLKKQKEHRLWILVGMVAACIPIFAFRQIVNAAILATPIIALTVMGKYTRWLMMGVVVLFWIVFGGVELVRYRGALDIDRSFSHLEEFITKHTLSGKAFNHIHFGGKLTYYFYPDIQVFYDTRDDLYLRTNTWQDLYTVFSNGQSIVPLLEKYDVDIVIGDVVTDQLNYMQLFSGSGWGVVYLDDRYLVALPKRVIAQKEMNEVPVDIYMPGGLRPGREELGLEYYKNNWTKNPSAGNRVYLTRALVHLGKCAEARRIDETVACKTQ